MKEWFEALHFLRPAWLWVMTAAPIILVAHHFREDVRSRWRHYIDPNLLDHLIVSPVQRWRFRPIHMICLLILIGSIALAGPSWKNEQPPFTEDRAPLVIALDLSETMDAIDLDPTRLERGKLKIRDLLKQRIGARTAMFVYAGTTHMVLPFTTDDSLFELYLSSLSTHLMPRPGKDTSQAIRTIEDFLKDEPVPGTVLFITDGIEPRAVPILRDFVAQNEDKDNVLVMGVGTSRGGPIRTSGNRFLTDARGGRVYSSLDVNALRNLSKINVEATSLTLNDDDIEWVQRRVQHHLNLIQQRNSKTRPIDDGYWLIIPIAAISVLWFRKGWTVRWTSSALAVIIISPPSIGISYPSWLDLWLTPDQQGRHFYERGEFEKAAEHFEDPLWRGIALERTQDYEQALNSFALSDTAEGWYNQGNALAHLGKYPEAVEAYRQAINQRHPWKEAEDNLALVQSLIPKPPDKKDKNQQQEEAPDLPPDQVKFDEKGKQGKKTATKIKLDPNQIADIWMRNIQTTPADFLRQRFSIQAAQERPQ
jgi:Ca-activated chloride channel family protein